MSHNTLTAPSSSRLMHKDKVWREGICTRADWTLALRRLNLGYYSLFVPSSNLPPRLARQGHSGRLRVFCLQSFSRLFGDEVVVHKRATPGSGPQRWRWFITRHGGCRGLMTSLLRRAAWNQEVFYESSGLIAALSPCGDLRVSVLFHCKLLSTSTRSSVWESWTRIFPPTASITAHLSDSLIRVKVMVYVIKAKLQP